MGTLRKIERGVLRRRYGSKRAGELYRKRRCKPKERKESALKRGLKSIFKAITGMWK